jgi:DNA-binding HxlR family transcriptional regulator
VTTRSYGQFCGVARAMEMVGERWSMLIVRDLLVGHRRFTDLRRGLPGIPSNILTTRLREMEDAGVLQRRALPRPDAGVVYELTEYGRELEGVVLLLGRWGAQSLASVREGEIVTTDSMVMALRSTFQSNTARGLTASYELRTGPVTIHARIDNGVLTVMSGSLAGVDLIIEAFGPLKPLLSGEISAGAAVSAGHLRIDGPMERLIQFADVFRIANTFRKIEAVGPRPRPSPAS